MALKRFSSLIVVAVAFLMLTAAHGPAAAQARDFKGVNKWCRTSDNRRLCTKMVLGATTWKGASMNAMTTTLALAKHVQTKIPLLKPVIAHLDPQSQESIMDTCNEDFSSKISDMEEGIAAMKTNDLGTVRTMLSAAYNTDCMDGLDQFGVECPFSMSVKMLQKEVDNCLAIVDQN